MKVREISRVQHALIVGLVAVFLAAAFFPHAHIVYPDAHNDARCPLLVLVFSGALVLPGAVVIALVLRALPGTTFRPAPVAAAAYLLPSSPRAPPLS